MALSDNLAVYYAQDEASGGGTDSHGSNHLALTNTVGSGTGKIAGCRVYTASGYLTASDAAVFEPGDGDFTTCCWVNLSSKATSQYLVAKWLPTGNQRSYGLIYNVATDRFQFFISANGSAQTAQDADNFGSPATGTWYFVTCRHSASANTIRISVNAGSPNSTSHNNGAFNGSANFRLGSRGDGQLMLTGSLDEAALWMRELSDAEVTDLYNSGNGRDYAYITSPPAGFNAAWASGSNVMIQPMIGA